MGKEFIYKNKLWKASHEFTYTGHGEKVTLDPGKYLLICNGAKGGKGAYNNVQQSGGSSYGILNVNKQTDLFAYVGGDGNPASLNDDVVGGYNGGGNGGRPYAGLSSTAYTGSSGGGATDIRTVESNIPTTIHTVPEEYNELEYLKPPKRGATNHQDNVIDTEYVLKAESTIECKLLAPNKGTMTPVDDPPPMEEIYIGSESEWRNGAWTGAPGGSWYPGWNMTLDRFSDNNDRIPIQPGETLTVYAEYDMSGYDAWVYIVYFSSQTSRPSVAGQITNSTWDERQRTFITPSNVTCFSVEVQLNPAGRTTFSDGSRRSISPSGLITVQIAKNRYNYNNDYDYPTGACMPFGANPTNSWGGSSTLYFQTRGSSSSNTAYFQRNGGGEPTVSGFQYDTPNVVTIHGYSCSCVSDGGAVVSATSTPSTLAGTTNTLTLFVPNFSPSDYPTDYGFSFSDASQWGFNGKIYYCKIYEGDKLVHYFVPVHRKSEYPLTLTLTSEDFEQGDSNSGSGDIESTSHCRMNHFLRADEFRGSVKVEVYDTDGNPLKWEMTTYNLESTVGENATYTTGFVNSGSNLSIYDWFGSYMRFIIKRDDEDTPISPEEIGSFTTTVTSTVPGMYDLVTQKFHANRAKFYRLEDGPVVESKTQYIEYGEDESLYSRIIVAGGGGGSGSLSSSKSYRLYDFSCGGGAVSGPIDMDNGVILPYPFATQDSGYSFGYGQNALQQYTNKSGNTNGPAGGGGGWFGGYSTPMSTMLTAAANLATMGSGGSGYVYTESSYKDEDHSELLPDESFYLTDTLLMPGQSIESSIYICEEIPYPIQGDEIICPLVGHMEHVSLPRGTYEIECYGGDGGSRYTFTKCGRGGYVKGTLVNNDISDIFINVGGSGLYASIPTYGLPEYNNMLNPTLSYNGGGEGTNTGTYQDGGTWGGGGTDIRVNSESLYARLIVAGGAGGMGYDGSFAGGGGGLTGGTDTGGVMYGDQAGPGTQTGTPTSAQSENQGRFGYGGNGSYRYNSSGSGYGGAGGGGWYGGSGTYPDTLTDDDRAGSGGSGFVLSETSFPIIPVGYELDEQYIMSDPILTESGNNLPYGISMIKIHAIDVSIKYIMCRDNQGFKIWDGTSWVFYSATLPSVDEFIEHGADSMTSDVGLLRSYRIYVYSADPVNYVSVYSSPNRQHIHVLTNSVMDPSDTNMDYISNPNFDIQYEFGRVRIGDENRLTIDMDIDKLTTNEDQLKLFRLSMKSYAISSNRYIEPKEDDDTPIDPSAPHKHLLTTTAINRIPIRYIKYLPTYSDQPISSIQCSVIAENNRMMYIMMTAKIPTFSTNQTLLRLVAVNMITGKSSIIMDKEYPSGFYVGGLLVNDKYVFFTSATNDSSRSLYRISLDDPDKNIVTFTMSSLDNYKICAFGKLSWVDDKTKEKVLMLTHSGYAIFNSKSNSFSYNVAGPNGAQGDFVITDNHIWSMTTGKATDFWAYNRSTGVWETQSGVLNNTIPRVCGGDGKGYIIQSQLISVFDDTTLERITTFTMPWTDNVVQCMYADNKIYVITTEGRLYIVDAATGVYDSIYLKWSISQISNTSAFRLFTIDNGIYLANFTLANVQSSRSSYKYAVGYKYSSYDFTFTSDNVDKCTYDERFITFHESYTSVHNGYTQSVLTKEEDVDIYSSETFNKQDYGAFINLKFTIEEGE
jgi:hypothetical protein